jgi:hypothetical protein
MKYGAEAEKELMTEIWSLGIKDDPLNFVKFVFPWGQKDTPLEHFSGPRKWQEKILRTSSISQDQGSGKKKFCEKLQHKYKGTTAK